MCLGLLMCYIKGFVVEQVDLTEAGQQSSLNPYCMSLRLKYCEKSSENNPE